MRQWLKRRKSATPAPSASGDPTTPAPPTTSSPARMSTSSHSTIGPLPSRRTRNSTAPKPGAPRPFERDSVGLPLALDIRLASGPGAKEASADSTQSFPSSIYPDPESAFLISPAAKELDSAKVGYGFERGAPNLLGAGAGFGGEMDEYDEDMPMPELYMDEKERMPAPRASLDSSILSPGQLSKLRIATPKMAQRASPVTVDPHGRPLPLPLPVQSQTALPILEPGVARETVCEVHASTDDCTDDCRAAQSQSHAQASRPLRPLPAQPQPAQHQVPAAHQPAPPQWEGDYEYAISPDTPSPAPGTGKKRGFLPLAPSPPHSRSPSPSLNDDLVEVKVPDLWSPRAERDDGFDREERMRALRKEQDEERAQEEKIANFGKRNKGSTTTPGHRATASLEHVLIPTSTLDLSWSSRTPPSPSPAATPAPTPIDQLPIQSRVFATEKRPPIVIKKRPKPLDVPSYENKKVPTPLATSIPPPPSEAPPAPPKSAEQSPLVLSAVAGPSGGIVGTLPVLVKTKRSVGNAAVSRARMDEAFEDVARKEGKRGKGNAAVSAAAMDAAFVALAAATEEDVPRKTERSAALSAAGMAAAFEGAAQRLRDESAVASSSMARSISPALSAADMATAFETAGTRTENPKKRSASPALSAAAMNVAFERVEGPVASSSKSRSVSPALSAASEAAAFEAVSQAPGTRAESPKKRSTSSAVSAAGMAAAFEATAQPVASSSKLRTISPALSAASEAAAFETTAQRSKSKSRSVSPAVSTAAMGDAFEAAARPVASGSNPRSVSPASSAAAMATAFGAAGTRAESPKKRLASPAVSAAGMAAAFEATAQRTENAVASSSKSRSVSPALSAASEAAAFEATSQRKTRPISPALSAAAMNDAFEQAAHPVASSSTSRSHSPAISAAGMAAAFEAAALRAQDTSRGEAPKKRSASPATSAAGMAAAFEAAAQRADVPVAASPRSRSISPAISAAGKIAAFEAIAQRAENPVASTSRSRSVSPALSAAKEVAAFDAIAEHARSSTPSMSRSRSVSPALSAANEVAAFDAVTERAESLIASTSRSRSVSPAVSAASMSAAFEAAAVRTDDPVTDSPKKRSKSAAVSAAAMATAFETAALRGESATHTPSTSRSGSPAASAAGMIAAFDMAAQRAESSNKPSGSAALSAAEMVAAFEAASRRAESPKKSSGSAALSAAGMAAAFEAVAAGPMSKKTSDSAAASAATMAAAFEALAQRPTTPTKRSGSPAASAASMATAFEAAADRVEGASPKSRSGSPAASAAAMAAAFEMTAQTASSPKKTSGSAAASAAGIAAAFEASAQRAGNVEASASSSKSRSGSPAASAAAMASAFEVAAQRAESPNKHLGSPAASAAGMAAAFEMVAESSEGTRKISGSAAASAAGMAAAFEMAAQRAGEVEETKTSGSAAASAAGMAAAFERAANSSMPKVVEPVPMKPTFSAAASAAGMTAAFEAAAAAHTDDMSSLATQMPGGLNASRRPMSTVSATTFATSVASSARSSMTESETESMTSSGTARPQQPGSAGLPLDVAEDMGVRTGSSSTTPVREVPTNTVIDENDVPLSQLRNDGRRETSMSPPRRTSSLQGRVGLPANPRPQSTASIPRPESSASLPRPLPPPPGHMRTSSTQSIRDATMSSQLMRSSSRPGSADRARASLSQQSSRSSLHPGSRASALRSGRSSPSQMPPRMSPPQGPLPSLPPTGAEGVPAVQGTIPPTYAFHDNSNTVFEAPLAMPQALPARAPMAEREPEASSTDSPHSQISVLTEFENTLAILDSEGEREPLPAYMLRAGTGEATLARGPRRAYRAAIPQVGGIIDINLSHLPADVRAALSGSEPSITSGAAPQPQSDSPDSDANAPNWPPRGLRLEPLDSGDVIPPTYMRVEGAGERRRARDRIKALFSRKRAISMSEAPVAVPLDRASSVMTSETSMSNSNGGGSLLRRIQSRRNDSSVTVNRMPEANASTSSLSRAQTTDGAMPAVEGFEGLPSMEPAEGRPLLRDGQILVYPEGEVCPHCGNTGYLPHNHSHDGSRLACPACWPKFARPFGAKLARFFRKGSLKGPDGERVRRRLQRPLSAPAGVDHAPAVASTSGSCGDVTQHLRLTPIRSSMARSTLCLLLPFVADLFINYSLSQMSDGRPIATHSLSFLGREAVKEASLTLLPLLMERSAYAGPISTDEALEQLTARFQGFARLVGAVYTQSPRPRATVNIEKLKAAMPYIAGSSIVCAWLEIAISAAAVTHPGDEAHAHSLWDHAHRDHGVFLQILKEMCTEEHQLSQEYAAGEGPIHSISSDVLRSIFLFCAAGAPSPRSVPRQARQLPPTPMVLRSVCQKWHEIVDSTPALWSDIVISLGPAYIKLAVDKGAPDGTINILLKADNDQIARLVFPEAHHRVKSLHFNLQNDTPPLALQRHFDDHTFPSLTRLAVHYADGDVLDLSSFFLRGSAPEKLDSLYLSYINIHPSSPAFSRSLVQLTLINCSPFLVPLGPGFRTSNCQLRA
ncbi:unnamed protein product [Peniophora sp. CBMAI 1063]|nr:unnamed protein product [Peniophora sp. CBMAI 1063]